MSGHRQAWITDLQGLWLWDSVSHFSLFVSMVFLVLVVLEVVFVLVHVAAVVLLHVFFTNAVIVMVVINHHGYCYLYES